MDSKEVKDIAELEVRRYFDHFLEKVHPKLMMEHTNSCKCGKSLNKFKWIAVGMCLCMTVVAPTIGAEIISLIKKVIAG
jgi:hypothetical protein